MVTEINYINIREILSRLTRHPLLQDLNLEQVVQYTLDFIALFGLPKMYEDKEMELHIENYRAILPCDLISIIAVRDSKTHFCLKAMADIFKFDENKILCYKTQGRALYTSFKTGDIQLSYRAMPIDEDGLPLLIDNSIFLKCLEAYIKKEMFTVLFDLGKINPQVLNNTQTQYSWLAGQLNSEFSIPSYAEMESIKSMWTSMMQKDNKFYNGFKDLSNNNDIRRH